MQDDRSRPGRRGRGRSRLERPGIPPRFERLFNLALAAVVVLFAFGWGIAVAASLHAGERPRITSTVTVNPVSPRAPPPAAFLLDAALRQLLTSPDHRGESGEVRVIIGNGDSLMLPDSLPPEVELGFREYDRSPASSDTAFVRPAPLGASVWNVLIRVRDAVRAVPELSVITLVPLSEKRGGRIGSYLIGDWPHERDARPPSAVYAPPAGLVRVTPENQDVHVSRHFRLRDFLTKGQADVWPKYVAMSPRLLDKLELTINELEAMGHAVHNIGVISGFRTPSYNQTGGSTAGRGALSRHMYGDAMDFYIDNERNGRMDDLNGDGRVDAQDLLLIVRAAERVEQKYPHLVGGIGLYPPTSAHGGFVHVDTRGFRARW